MLKIIRLLAFLKSHFKKRDIAAVINYEITSRCNLNCEHCYWRKTLASKKELSDEEWEKIFLLHKSKGATTAFLTGGEPALRQNVIKIANQIFEYTFITSNGVIKIPEEIQRRIFISIDGPKEIHNKIRGAGVFDKIMQNIKNDKRVIITPTLSTTNYKFIDNLVKIARESNVDGITFSLYTSHIGDNDPLILKGEELEWTLKKLEDILKNNPDIVLLTPKILKLFKTKEYVKNCYFRGKHFISFDANLNQKKPCVLGEGVNCNTCGCIVPAATYAVKKLDIRSWLMFNRLFPETLAKRNIQA